MKMSEDIECPIGKGKILDCDYIGAGISGYKLYLKIEVNGVLFEGALRPVKVSEDEEE